MRDPQTGRTTVTVITRKIKDQGYSIILYAELRGERYMDIGQQLELDADFNLLFPTEKREEALEGVRQTLSTTSSTIGNIYAQQN